MNYDFNIVTKDFDTLYKNVTKEINKFTSNSSNNNLTNYEVDWINKLVDGFKLRYDKWDITEDKYLRQAHSKRGRLFWLSACAFLHIANDLPIVIERNLDKLMLGKEIFRHKLIFNKLEIPLEETIKCEWEKPLGINILFWRGWRTEKIFLHWMFNIRNRAWDYALFLLYSPNINVSIGELNKKVLGAMISAQNKATFWDRVLSLRLGLIASVILGFLSVVFFQFSIFLEIVTLLGLLEGGWQLDNMLERKVYKDFLSEFYFNINEFDNERQNELEEQLIKV
jgi:hypothetical protein